MEDTPGMQDASPGMSSTSRSSDDVEYNPRSSADVEYNPRSTGFVLGDGLFFWDRTGQHEH